MDLEEKMKKILYFALLLAELFVGSLLMISLWDSSLYVPIVIAAVLLVGLLTWMIIWFCKAADSAVRKKILFFIPLIMLIPCVIAFAFSGF